MEGNSQKTARRLPKPNNIVTVPAGSGIEFFRWWCMFLRPFVKLTNREIDVVASFLMQRWELSKKISDPSMLDTLLMSEKVKGEVIRACGIKQQHLYEIMSNLRKSHVIVDNIINPRLIPNIRQDDNGCFQLLILFKDVRKPA